MPRYLGSKFPLENRALHTFSCIDPTARGNEWTGKLLKTIPELLSWAPAGRARVGGRPLGKKMFSLYVGTFYYFFELQANSV